MKKAMLFGANGYMGKEVTRLSEGTDIEIAFGVDKESGNLPFPIFPSPFDCDNVPDVIIDFSNHTAILEILSYATKHQVPCVICATGHTKEELDAINQASKSIAIFKSANMSLGINLLSKIAKIATAVLEGYDIEIIEKHHNRKLDAPSGTALLLFDEIKSIRDELEPVYSRAETREKRNNTEVGISAIRGGNIVGEHEILFIGENEIITLSHKAEQRAVFAEGAIKAALFVAEKEFGLFQMSDIV